VYFPVVVFVFRIVSGMDLLGGGALVSKKLLYWGQWVTVSWRRSNLPADSVGKPSIVVVRVQVPRCVHCLTLDLVDRGHGSMNSETRSVLVANILFSIEGRHCNRALQIVTPSLPKNVSRSTKPQAAGVRQCSNTYD
jgi:hypothetical protein